MTKKMNQEEIYRAARRDAEEEDLDSLAAAAAVYDRLGITPHVHTWTPRAGRDRLVRGRLAVPLRVQLRGHGLEAEPGRKDFVPRHHDAGSRRHGTERPVGYPAAQRDAPLVRVRLRLGTVTQRADTEQGRNDLMDRRTAGVRPPDTDPRRRREDQHQRIRTRTETAKKPWKSSHGSTS